MAKLMRTTSGQPIENLSEEMDRSPPIAVFLSADSFFQAACHLQEALEAQQLSLRFHMPIYCLYTHALELTLKAFLRTKGFTSSELASSKFGHKLQNLWETCVTKGLRCHPVTEAFITQAIELLDPFATDYEFRYVKIGFKYLPTLGTVKNAVADLMEFVQSHCQATIKRPILDEE